MIRLASDWYDIAARAKACGNKAPASRPETARPSRTDDARCFLPTAPADGDTDWHSIGGLTPESSAADIKAALDSRMAEIAQLQDNANLVETSDTFTTMSLDQALAHYGFTSGDLSQQQFDQLINNISSRIDSLNSSQQLDMLRLQSLTNKRNESFDIMTNFIKKLQDNRSSIIGNMR